MTTPHKLHVRIGHAEFIGEGSEATVNEQYNRFLELVRVVGSAQWSQLLKDDEKNEQEGGGGGAAQKRALPPPKQIDTALLQRVFREHNDAVSLTVLPSGENQETDALVMLLYGFREIKKQTEVSASVLLEAARQSGLTLERLDRVLVRTDHVRKGGTRKWSRYALTNPGIVRAEELVSQMFS